MSTTIPVTDDADTPVPFLTKEERDALVLEFQRLAARLARARLLSTASATRIMKSITHERRAAEEKRSALSQLVLDVLLSIEDGTLKESVHFIRREADQIALHLASSVPAMRKVGRAQHTMSELRSLFDFGRLHFRDVVQARAERARFDGEGDRRRVVVLHEPAAYEFVGARKKAVPFR